MERGQFNKTLIVSRIAFTKDLFKENPECLDLNEVLDEADNALAAEKYGEANELIESAVRSCRDLITSKAEPIEQAPGVGLDIWKLIGIVIAITLLALIAYEVFRYKLGGKIGRRLGIISIILVLGATTQITFTGFAAKSGGGVLDLISLQIIIAVDVILLITYLRMRFSRRTTD